MSDLPHVEDVMSFIVNELVIDSSIFASYGYGVYLERAMQKFVTTFYKDVDPNLKIIEISPVFYDAAWELTRRGILRPGILKKFEQITNDGSAGNGYCLTPFGKIWLSDSQRHLYVPTEPERFAKMLGRYRELFGENFQQRAMEAVRCYNANAHLACSVMCGAAAEVILLNLAIKIVGDKVKVLKKYNGSSGVDETCKSFQRIDPKLSQRIRQHLDLMKFWRDEAAHAGGVVTVISNEEAFTALALLLRFAEFAKNVLQDT